MRKTSAKEKVCPYCGGWFKPNCGHDTRCHRCHQNRRLRWWRYRIAKK